MMYYPPPERAPDRWHPSKGREEEWEPEASTGEQSTTFGGPTRRPADPRRTLLCGCTLQLVTPGPGMVDVRPCPTGERLAAYAAAGRTIQPHRVYEARWAAYSAHLARGMFKRYGDDWGMDH